MLTALCCVALGPPLTPPWPAVSLDASAGAKGGAQRAAVSVWYAALQPVARVHLSAGLRISAYRGDPTAYTNRGVVQGNLLSSLTVDPAVYAVDAAVAGELGLLGGVTVGANLDLVGVATGPTQTMGSLMEKPQAFSYFRYGSADHGALNSEFFVSLRLSERTRLRAGVSHYVTNYAVTDTAAANAPNTRYQKFQTVPFVAVSLRL